MNKKIFDINVKASHVLSEESSWKDLWLYFYGLIDSQKEPRMKSSSGILTIQYMPYGDIQAELGGYDTLSMSRHEYVSAPTELELKVKIIALFERERLALLDREED